MGRNVLKLFFIETVHNVNKHLLDLSFKLKLSMLQTATTAENRKYHMIQITLIDKF